MLFPIPLHEFFKLHPFPNTRIEKEKKEKEKLTLTTSLVIAFLYESTSLKSVIADDKIACGKMRHRK